MITGRVIGEMHATIQHPFYDGKKKLLVEKTKPDGQPTGDYVIAVDTVGAGVGEAVLILDEGNSARQIVDSTTAPLRTVIAGIIDRISVE